MLFFPHKKSVRQADSKPAICRIWLERGRSGMKWFLTKEIPLSPASSLSPKPENPSDGHLPSEQPRWLLQGSQINTECVCACAHTKVFSKPAVDVYSFPSPQLAVKHLIQQLWPSANSALRTLSATSLGQDTRKSPAGDLNDLPCCILHLRFSSHSP